MADKLQKRFENIFNFRENCILFTGGIASVSNRQLISTDSADGLALKSNKLFF